mgnify:CR=1 FL=1
MNKIAFVVVRYGKDINGGAEYHCKMLAERLVNNYQVEVLTTCVKDYTTGKNVYPEGVETINNVLVRRFKAEPTIDRNTLLQSTRKARKASKLRKFLYKFHILAPISFFFPVWTYREKWEVDEFIGSPLYSSSLIAFIKEHQDDYNVFIPITIDHPAVIFTALHVPRKTIVIPTMHYLRSSFRSVMTKVFTKVAYIAFNTHAEEKLAQRIFGFHMSSHGIVSVGYELATPADWKNTSSKYQLPPEYLLYVGRIDRYKLNKIFDYFATYKQIHKESQLKFVVVGGLFCEPYEHPDILYTGFVDDHEKRSIIEHAKIVINPSKYESLSLILLETMALKKPILVNAHCNVMKEHCKKSNHAALTYHGKRDFIKKLHLINSSEILRTKMGEKGAIYIKNNYNWELIIQRLKNSIEYVSSQSSHDNIEK